MSGKRAKKKGGGSAARPLKRVMLTKGDWLDVMDSDGVWNVARVLSVPSPGEVEIKYDGWPPEYDEVVRIDSDRVAPYHTYTWSVKCWVRYLNWPLWPSLITIRTPGNEKGVEHLRRENRLFVDFLDNPDFSKRDRCWNPKRNVRAFDKDFDENRKHTNGDLFENSLQLMLQSNAAKNMPKFSKGTLPAQYASSVTEPVSETRRTMGENLWLRNFANNRERHFLTHVYEDIGIEPRDALGHDFSDSSDGEHEAATASGPHFEEPLKIAYKSEDDSEGAVTKKKPAKKARRPKTLTPKIEPKETKPKIEQHPMSPTGPGKLFPSVLVMKDEIIVVDDDDDDSDRYDPKHSSKRPRLLSTTRSRRSSTLRKDSPSSSTPRKTPPRITTPRKAPVEPVSPRKASSRPPSARRGSPAVAISSGKKSTTAKPADMESKRRSPENSSNDDNGVLPAETSFEPDAKDVPPRRSGTPQNRKLPAKEIAAKTREDRSRRMGHDDKTDGHKQAWLDMLSQADAKGPPVVRISEEQSEAKSDRADSKSSNKRVPSARAAAKRTSLDAEVVGEFENSFISPDYTWMDNGIEYAGNEEPAVEEDSAKDPPALSVSPMQRRKMLLVSPKRNAAHPRLMVESYNVMDVDPVESRSSPRVPPTSTKAQLPTKALVSVDATSSAAHQKKPAKSQSKRSLLEQSIAAAQAVMASMGTSRQDDLLEPSVPARRKRLKVTARTLQADIQRAESLPVQASESRSTVAMGASPSAVGFSLSAAPLWTRPAPEADATRRSDSDDESKMSAIPDPPVIESAENSSVRAESLDGESSIPSTLSKPSTVNATPASADFSRGHDDGLEQLLMASDSISLQTAMKPPEVVPDIPRRFCMMRVGDRVGSAMNAQTKTRTLHGLQHSFILVSAPHKFGDNSSPPLSLDATADPRSDSGRSDSVSSASASSLAQSMLSLNGTASPSAASKTSSRPPPPPGALFDSSAGFSMRSWFKRSVYASFLSPQHHD